jgi:hypothetical protein
MPSGLVTVTVCFSETLAHSQNTVSPRFMRGLRSAKTSHISNALTYREKGVACNNVKYVSNAF